MTSFEVVYDRFFDIVTDDFYSEVSSELANRDCKALLMASLPMFEFPKRIFSFTTEVVFGEPADFFEQDLTLEEINILAFGMTQVWAQRQATSIENTRQKFSGPDFKQSSQAAHLQRLLKLLEDARAEHRRLQMLYSRRRIDEAGEQYESNFDMLVKPMNRKAPN